MAAFTIVIANLFTIEVSIMEARNFITAREMLSDGNWILTTLNGQARYQKPPLPTWLTAWSAAIFGIEKIWALRIPAALLFMSMGMGVFTLSRKLNLPKNQSLLNGLIALTSLYAFLIIFEAPWDIFAHTFMLWSIVFFVDWIQEKKRWRNGFLACVLLAAAILSKGPVSVYVLFLPFFVIYFLVNGRSSSRKQIAIFLGIVVLGIVLGCSWYGYVRWQDYEAFERITQQETKNWSNYHIRPFYYYWSFFVQSGLWTIPAFISLLFPYLKTRVDHLEIYKLSLGWTVLAVVLLSLIPEKKSRYLMPVLIPLAMTLGFYLNYLIVRFKTFTDLKEKLPAWINFGSIGVIYIASIGVMLFAGWHNKIVWWAYVLLLLIVGIGIALVRALFYKKDIETAIYISMAGYCIAALTAGLLSRYNPINPNYTPFSGINNHGELPIYAYKTAIPEMIWAYGDKLPKVNLEDLTNEALDQEFLLLEYPNEDFVIPKNGHNYRVQLIDSLDLNKALKGSSNYKKRKTSKVYRLKRKP